MMFVWTKATPSRTGIYRWRITCPPKVNPPFWAGRLNADKQTKPIEVLVYHSNLTGTLRFRPRCITMGLPVFPRYSEAYTIPGCVVEWQGPLARPARMLI